MKAAKWLLAALIPMLAACATEETPYEGPEYQPPPRAAGKTGLIINAPTTVGAGEVYQWSFVRMIDGYPLRYKFHEMKLIPVEAGTHLLSAGCMIADLPTIYTADFELRIEPDHEYVVTCERPALVTFTKVIVIRDRTTGAVVAESEVN